MPPVANLYQVRSTYYFRTRIPKDLLQWFQGKEDIKRSLRTKSLTQARRLLKVWCLRTEETFTTMRSGILPPEQIRKIAEDFKHSTLTECEVARRDGIGIPRDEVQQEVLEGVMVDKEAEAQFDLIYNDFSRIKFPVMETITEKGLDILPGSADFAALCRAFLQRSVEIYQIERERIGGNGYDDATPLTVAPASEHPAAPKASLMLSDAVSRYIEEAKTMEKAGEATIYEAITKCNQFVKIVHDKPVCDLTRDDVLRFLDVLKRLPPNASKSPKYREKSIDELLAMKVVKTMSATTVDNYMTRIKSFLEWCVRLGHLSRNPADGVTYGKKKLQRPDELRKVFSKSDLEQLTNSYLSITKGDPKQLQGRPERVWLPLISLFSGMRVNEIAQLHSGDVLQDQESGIWYFNIDVEISKEEGEGTKRVKTAAARRLIPVHPTLEKLGFIDYVKTIHAEGVPRYWMNLNQTGRGYHKSFANWFLGNGTHVGFLRKHVTTDPKIKFHSFRHTFADALKQKGVVHQLAAELMGHAQEDMTYGRYGKSGSLKTKLKAISEIEYGVDFLSLNIAISCCGSTAIMTGD